MKDKPKRLTKNKKADLAVLREIYHEIQVAGFPRGDRYEQLSNLRVLIDIARNKRHERFRAARVFETGIDVLRRFVQLGRIKADKESGKDKHLTKAQRKLDADEYKIRCEATWTEAVRVVDEIDLLTSKGLLKGAQPE